MVRFGVTCVLALFLPSLALGQIVRSLEERVHEAALVTYVHGMTEEIARREVGTAGVPVLLDLLRDPEFPRRDNVVAFLAYLGSDLDAPTLVEAVEHPPVSDDRPEDLRARLLAGEALGRIAARGGKVARAALDRLERSETVAAHSAMRELVEYGIAVADGTLEEIALSQEEETVASPSSIDGNASSHALALTYANHVDTNDKITDAEVDALLRDISLVLGTENATNDTACCIELFRSGAGGQFGTPGNGQDVITSSGEMNSVLNNSVARIKVVDLIQWCGGSGTNIIGCGSTPGNGIALVRFSGTANEGKLWAHELGHNTGLPHNGSTTFLMYGALSSSNTKLTAAECNNFHFPSGSAGLVVTNIGSCHDNDGDNVVSSVDNCPATSNGTQVDSDSDDLGNLCDNCVSTQNPDQLDCDADGLGDACDPSMAVPNPIQAIYFSQPDVLTWSLNFAAKNIYRGGQNVGEPWHPNHQLVGSATNLAQSWPSPLFPAQNQLHYYLVTAFNGCGESD